MNRVDQIENQIRELSSEEIQSLRAWLAAYEADLVLHQEQKADPEELAALGRQLAESSDPVEMAVLRERLTRGFYGH